MARKQYPLRIDPAVWDAVCKWADDDFRSVNAQVEWIIRDALKRAGRSPRPSEEASEPLDGGDTPVSTQTTDA